jgi:hypothetical protein
MTSGSIIHMNLHKPNNKLVNVWLEHFWCTDKPQAYTYSQDSPGLNLGEATTFPLIVFFVPSHRACIQMSFCPGSPEIGTLATLEAHNFLFRPSIEVMSKAKL